MPMPAYDGSASAASVIMSPTTRVRPVLFVEGTCEVRLIAHHFPECDTQILACGGHEGVREAIATIETWEKVNNTKLLVLGFIDRDYGCHHQYRRITTSNYRDVEIDMYKSKAGERLLREKASRKKCSDARATLDRATEELRNIGLIRRFNSNKGSQWNINNVNLERCINSDGEVNTDKFISHLQQKNGMKEEELNSLRNMLKAYDRVMTESVIRGHDLSILLGKWLRKKIGNRSKAETNWGVIEEDLRLSTDINELLQYNWARRIKKHLTG